MPSPLRPWHWGRRMRKKASRPDLRAARATYRRVKQEAEKEDGRYGDLAVAIAGHILEGAQREATAGGDRRPPDSKSQGGSVDMKLKDIMTREVEVVRPDSTLQEAATKMK